MRQNPSLAQFPTQILLFWSSWTLGRMSSLWELELSMEPGRDGSVSSWAGDETFRALVLRWKRAAALCLLPTQAGTCCWCCFQLWGRLSVQMAAAVPCPSCHSSMSWMAAEQTLHKGDRNQLCASLCWHTLLAVFISTRVHVFTSNEEMGSRKYRWGVSSFMFFVWLYTSEK